MLISSWLLLDGDEDDDDDPEKGKPCEMSKSSSSSSSSLSLIIMSGWPTSTGQQSMNLIPSLLHEDVRHFISLVALALSFSDEIRQSFYCIPRCVSSECI